MPPSNAHHRQVNTNSAQPPEEEKKSEYGSREADQAAKQLQDLGAMVYPPGNKDTIDWGMLAGIPMAAMLTIPQGGLKFHDLSCNDAMHVTSVSACWKQQML